MVTVHPISTTKPGIDQNKLNQRRSFWNTWLGRRRSLICGLKEEFPRAYMEMTSSKSVYIPDYTNSPFSIQLIRTGAVVCARHRRAEIRVLRNIEYSIEGLTIPRRFIEELFWAVLIISSASVTISTRVEIQWVTSRYRRLGVVKERLDSFSLLMDWPRELAERRGRTLGKQRLSLHNCLAY